MTKDRVAMKTEGTAGTAATPGFELVEIARKEKPDVRFTGRLLGEVDSKANGDRWTKLALWELKSGAWVAAEIGCSNKPGEIDIGEVEVVEPAGSTAIMVGVPDKSGPFDVKSASRTREQVVMGFFGWTWLAKKLAAELDWDVDEVIE